ncbi:MAG: 2-oxoacid:acceptor oxidoreductase family protein [Candidatus Binatia bacterium]
MEREILMTGIGGQGIQLTSKILAEAANREGRNVMHFGVYGGMIRGGPSDCTIVVSTEEILAPPIVEQAWCLIAMHPGSMPALLGKIRSGGIVVANSTLVHERGPRPDLETIEVPATRIAEEAGRIVGASMVALGAFVEATGLVSMAAVLEAMDVSIPAHRRSLLELNRKCLALGEAWIRDNPKISAGTRAWAPAATFGVH